VTDRIGTDKNGKPRTRGALDRTVRDIVEQNRKAGIDTSPETVRRRVGRALERHDRRR